MAKRKTKKKSSLKRIINLIILFVILAIASLFIAPTEEEYNNSLVNQESTSIVVSGKAIPNLYLPALIDGEQVVNHIDYTLSYNEKAEQPSWVAYELDSNEIYGPAKRKNNFKADSTIKTGSATLADYKGSGYDRGHLCPAADQKESDDAMSESFFMSNMSPQAPDLNRKIWADLEAVVRNFADTNGKIYVATGPILTDGPYDTIGENKVAIPNFYYKVILDYSEPEIKSIGFILPNEGSDKSLESFATTINEVERETGLDFFYQLPDDIEEQIESKMSTSQWQFKEFIASQGTGSFDEDAVIVANAPISTTTTGGENDIKVILKNGTNYILMQLRKETTSLIIQFIPSDILKALNII
jgi:endonuclease G